jgi:hypothetical protein
MERIAEVRFQNADTEVLAMANRGEVVALTGRPFGYMHWNVSADPENPRLVFAASDQIDTFAPKGRWVVDWYASGAVGLFGQYGFLSGTAGLSVISLGETSAPREVLRIPDVNPNTTTVDVPDDPFLSKDGETQDRIDAYEDDFGNRTIRLYGDDPISDVTLSLNHSVVAEGDTGDSDICYTLNWTSTSESVLIEFAGHLSVTGTAGEGSTAWGPGLGSGSISGGPYHFTVGGLDGQGGSLDNKVARIAQGTLIPFSQVSAQGVQTTFQEAKLQLLVQPHVTADGSVSLNVKINRDEPDFNQTSARGDPTILKREAETTLLVMDGHTAVIGGIFTRNTGRNLDQVPFFGDIPLIGLLFQRRRASDSRSELVIFITPRIVNRAEALGR